jgi:hypothetical protein
MATVEKKKKGGNGEDRISKDAVMDEENSKKETEEMML